MSLKNKNAIIYGAGGSLGSAIAKALANAGARVFLVGKNTDSLQKLAAEITAAGGQAEYGRVDALDKKSVNDYLDRLVQKTGSIDISFCLISLKDLQNIPLVDMEMEDFVRPVEIAMRSHFLTAAAAGKQMRKQGSGTILSLTATPASIAYPLVGGFGPACSAIESFSRGLATELGPYGIRVINIRSGGSPDSRVFQEAIASDPVSVGKIIRKMEEDSMLKKLPMMADIANVAVFLCSEMAGKITGVTIDVTSGTTAGLNYKMGNVPFK
jgi:NAD(P)-dependent dehydrogenase (short-subunit alcohol dehydrogenase family)